MIHPTSFVGTTVGSWKVIGHERGTSRGDSTYRIECTDCGEAITSRWNKFGTKHPRLCTCHPEYRGKGRPPGNECVVQRPSPSTRALNRVPYDRESYTPEIAGARRRLVEAEMRIPPMMPHKLVIGRMLTAARSRCVAVGMDFDLSTEFLEAMYVHQTGFCAVSGMAITLAGPEVTASIDRKDSQFGYVAGNVQWVHRMVNRMKMDHDHETFVEACKAVANHAEFAAD